MDQECALHTQPTGACSWRPARPGGVRLPGRIDPDAGKPRWLNPGLGRDGVLGRQPGTLGARFGHSSIPSLPALPLSLQGGIKGSPHQIERLGR